MTTTDKTDDTAQTVPIASRDELHALRHKFLEMHLEWMRKGADLLHTHSRLIMLEEVSLAAERKKPTTPSVQ